MLSILAVGISLLTACTKNTDNQSPKESVAELVPVESPLTTPISTAVSPTPTVVFPTPTLPSPRHYPTVQLFDIEDYDGTEKKKTTIQGKDESSGWIRPTYSEFGFYMPPQIKQVKVYEGHEYKLQNDIGLFLIIEENSVPLPKEPTWDQELVQYEEYIGSSEDGVWLNDFFMFEYKELKYIVKLSYRDVEQQEEARPIFLDVMKSIRYSPLK